MNLDRREFLATSLAAAGAAALTHPALAQTAAKAANPYELVPLGKTGLKVSRIGFGTGMRGGNRQSNQTRLGREAFEGLLQQSYERGMRLFDMADMYGSHAYVGRALKKYPRDSYVLVSKIWQHPRGGIPEAERPPADQVVDRFRKEIDSDYVDLVLLHCMMRPKWIDDMKAQMDKLAELKEKKIIRAHGVSIHNFEALQACATSPWVDSVHARINAYGEKMDDKDPAKVAAVLKQIHDAGKGVIGMKLIGEGSFRDSDEKRDKSIAYVLDLGTVDSMIVGFENIKEVDDFEKRVRKAMAAKV